MYALFYYSVQPVKDVTKPKGGILLTGATLSVGSTPGTFTIVDAERNMWELRMPNGEDAAFSVPGGWHEALDKAISQGSAIRGGASVDGVAVKSRERASSLPGRFIKRGFI